MGRQIIFHMLPEDRMSFFDFVQQRDPVVVTDFTDSVSGVVQAADLGNRDTKSREWLAFGTGLCCHLSGVSTFRSPTLALITGFDSSLPILEFSLPVQRTWDGDPALTQGRLYAYAYRDYPALRIWYEALVRWLRTRFTKNPIGWMSGYVGPEAYRWYKNGGLLLPFCAPPVNAEWRERIHGQHRGS